MTSRAVVESTRRSLGSVGAFVGVSTGAPHAGAQIEAARRLQDAGWNALWTNEIVGTDALVRSALWLAATDRMVIGTCIANVWARPAQTAHAAATQLVQAHPGRFILGLGVGRPEQAAQVGRSFGSAVQVARAYLRDTPEADYPRLLAANGPKLLTAARELADGALPAGRPPTATAGARQALGPDKLLVVYVPITAADDAAAVAEDVTAHLGAGADHVILGMSLATELEIAVQRLEALGPEITPRH